MAVNSIQSAQISTSNVQDTQKSENTQKTVDFIFDFLGACLEESNSIQEADVENDVSEDEDKEDKEDKGLLGLICDLLDGLFAQAASDIIESKVDELCDEIDNMTSNKTDK